MCKACILIPSKFEFDGIVDNLKRQGHFFSSASFHSKALRSDDLVFISCGIGKAQSAIICEKAIQQFSPSFVVLAGLSGGLSSDHSIGDSLWGSKVLEVDFISSFKKRPSQFQLETPSFATNSCVIASSDLAIESADQRLKVHELYGAQIVAMESAGVARCAAINKVPSMELRAISDLSEIDMDKKEFHLNSEKALHNISLQLAQLMYGGD